MSGYIGSRASVVSSGAERKQIVNVTTTTTTISGVSYTPGFVDVFHNGIRLVQDTDFTATNGSSITLTNAAENGDQIVVKTSSTFSPADAVSKGGDTMTGDLTVPTVFTSMVVADSALSGFRNAIINGNFDHWQRGASLSGAGYLADRWVHNVAGASGTVTQSRQAFTVGQTDVPNEPTYFYRIQGSSYTMTAGNVTQRIEDVRTFAGQTVTLSFYARASAARDIRPRFHRVFDGSAPVDTVASPVSLTTSWQKFTATVSIPSIAGKTVGANSRLELAFDIKEGAFGSDLGNDSIDIAQVQLEAGSVATPFERRPVGTELALCQRYFELVDAPALMPRADNGGTGRNCGVIYWKVNKRANPTVVGSGYNYEGHHVSTPGILNQSPTGVRLEFVGGDYRGGGGLLFWDSFTADAEL